MQKRKWRVLIVDDEFRIGMLIKKLIRWEEFPLECADIVDNGEAAFHIIKEREPDIVITDIRMPKINGLDLICMTRELKKDIKFVVISGYKEFEYAHRALQYGVDDYLLKPINEDELNKVLGKICGQFELMEKETREKLELQETVAESKQIIRRDFLNNIIEQGGQPQMEDARVPLEGEIYRGIDIKLDYVDYRKSDKKQDRITGEKVMEIVEKILNPAAEEVLICEKENLHIYCLFNYDDSRAKEIRGKINDILSEIQEYLLGFEQYEVTIGVGTERKDFAGISYSIKESKRAVLNRIKLGTGRLIYVENVFPENKAKNPVARYKESFLASIESYGRENLELCINQIYSGFIMRDDIDFSVCYSAAEELIEIFFESMDVQPEEFRQMVKNTKNSCQHCGSVLKLKKLLKTELGNYLDIAREAVETESAKPVRQAKQYIEEHFGEKIVLEDIAAVVELNPVYFSVLFKKETEMNFSAYLLNVRMEKAKEMLCTTNETIAAIGESVGYRDSRYFSQTFTKTVGVKPALYRKLHS